MQFDYINADIAKLLPEVAESTCWDIANSWMILYLQNRTNGSQKHFLLFFCGQVCDGSIPLLLKILPPPAPVHQPDQFFGAKKQHSTRQPRT